jgi:hypothetical protein
MRYGCGNTQLQNKKRDAIAIVKPFFWPSGVVLTKAGSTSSSFLGY